MTRWILIAITLLLASPALADHAKYGRQVRYAGIHPIPKSEGGGMCYIEGPHVHIYAANKLEYRDHRGDHVFVGDTGPYGYDGPKYTYNGPHPVHVDAVVGGDPDVEYCYIQGPHYHYFAPPDGPDFQVRGDAYFYVGAPPQAMIEARPQYVGINAYYQQPTFVYERPVVTVEPPQGWIGVRAEFAAPGVVVEAPGAVVETPGVVVVGKHRGAVVAPGVAVEGGVGVVVPAPSVHVGVGVMVGAPPPAVVVRPAPVIIEGHTKVKHMKHRGR